MSRFRSRNNLSETYDNNYLTGVPRRQQELHDWSFAVTNSENGIARIVTVGGSAEHQVEQNYMHIEQKPLQGNAR